MVVPTPDPAAHQPSEGESVSRDRHAKLADYAIAASFASWSVGAALALGQGDAPPWPVRCAAACVHAVAAWLFVVRTPAIETAPWRSLLVAAPSLLSSGLAFRLGAARLEGVTLVLFVLGAAGTCFSLLTLGRSFAIFVARRELVARGPYALVRHPAYACELVMIVATTIAGGSLDVDERVLGVPRGIAALAIASMALVTIVLRAREEERFLAGDAAYAAYAKRVRARLVPFVW
jgi:protein-S-isoprenylcysteine O-methyltransferase Ste14